MPPGFMSHVPPMSTSTPPTPSTPHTPVVPDISTMADITHRRFVVPEIIEHQDIADELPVIVTASELLELTYSVVDAATCRQKSRLVSSFNHMLNKKTLKSGDIVWQYTATIKQIGKTFVTEAYPHICVSKASALPGAKIRAQLH